MTFLFLSPLMALMAPFLVALIEWFLPYPHLVEELVKAGLVFSILSIKPNSQQLKLAVLMGFLFAVSETVLYSLNFFLLDSFFPLVLRLGLTTGLHVATMLCLLLPTFINRRLIYLGLLLAIILHYGYNLVFY